MENPETYHLLVLGSGEAGKYLAWTLAKNGHKVAVIEQKYIGGSCPNIACLPSKNVIHSAKIASHFWRSEEFGISKENCRINMAAVRDRKRKMVDDLVQIHLASYEASGAELIIGSGRFIEPKTIRVALPDGSNRTLRGENVVISTGSRAVIGDTPGLREAVPLTHVEALELDHIPPHLLILGGGFIGLEFAQAMRRFGSKVTIIERNAQLAHREDNDVSIAFHEVFQQEGIELVTDASATRVEGRSGDSVHLFLRQGENEITRQGTHLLVATGRTPNTDKIGLETAGVETTEHGFVKVDACLQTTASGVWAVGDCAGSPHFTHVAFDDFRVVKENLAGGHRTTAGRQVPFCVFTDPEFARIGLSETEAKQGGIAYRLAKIPMSAVLRSRTLSETQGFMKALIDAKTDQILGFAVFGVGAGEIMAVVQVAMIGGMPYTSLRDAIFTHPTLPEGLIPLFSSVPPMGANSAERSK